MTHANFASPYSAFFERSIQLPFDEDLARTAWEPRDHRMARLAPQPDSMVGIGKLLPHANDPLKYRLFDREAEYELPIEANPDPDVIEDPDPTTVAFPLTAAIWKGVITAVNSSQYTYKAVSVQSFTQEFWSPILNRTMETTSFQTPVMRKWDAEVVSTVLASIGDTCTLAFDGPDYNDVRILDVPETMNTEVACR